MTTASGGVITYITISGVYYAVHAFTEAGDFIVTKGGDVDVLIVAGGGGGGNNGASGGGAGGLIYETEVSTTAQTYSIIIGDGGTGATSNAYAGLSGDDSSAFGHTATGGGGGARPSVDYGPEPEMDGGSGGGGDTDSASYGLGVAGQGHDGGTPAESGTTWYVGAGGGGAGAVGGDGSTQLAGAGGAGTDMSSYFGTDYGESGYFAGGGGGGAKSGTAADGGIGGGGDGGDDGVTQSQTAGAANTGGGGGGGAASSRNGQNGGSGIVIIRYALYTGYFSGYTYELGTPVQRELFLHHRNTGRLIDNTTSSGNGYYYLETTYSGAHYIVCLDDAAGESYNDLIIGNVYPEEVV